MAGRGGKKGPAGRGSAQLRVADEVRMKLAQLMMRDLDDPRLDGVHLTRVEMTPDLAVARVFWRTTPGAASEDVATSALKSAAPFLRRKLGAALRLRGTPQLDFRLDALVDSGDRMESLLAGLVASRAARPASASADDPADDPASSTASADDRADDEE